MRLAVYGAVLVITLGSVLLGIDWLSAPMSPMADTEAGLHAPPARNMPATSNANIGAPIVPPSLAPAAPNAPASASATAQPAPAASVAAPEPAVHCNVDACTAAYRTFRASDCTYVPSAGQRKLCTK